MKFFLALGGSRRREQSPSSHSDMMIIDNINKNDDEHEEVRLILASMRQQESSPVYLRHVVKDDLVVIWRRMLVEWMYYVVDYCHLQRQSVAAATFFLDHCMSRGLCVTREQHQLAAATCLQLALKTFDTAVIKLEKLVKLGRGQFTQEDVAQMELSILDSLQWHIHPPSIYCFLRQYERLMPHDNDGGGANISSRGLDEVTKLLSELMVMDENYVRFSSSILAYAAMLVAMEILHHDTINHSDYETFVHHVTTVANLKPEDPEVVEAIDQLQETLDQNHEKLAAVLAVVANVATAIATRSARMQPYEKVSSQSRPLSRGSPSTSPSRLSSRASLPSCSNKERYSSPRDVMACIDERQGSTTCSNNGASTP